MDFRLLFLIPQKIEQTVAQKIRGSPRYDESRT